MIRAADEADVPQIQALWNAMIRDTTATFTTEEKTRTGIAEMIADRRDRFFVFAPDAVAGFVTWGPFRAGPGYAHTAEHTIILTTKGQGIGRALMDFAEQRAATQGIHAMIAGISSDNPAAQAFHGALGYVQVGLLPQVGRKDGRWLDLIFMQKLLNAA